MGRKLRIALPSKGRLREPSLQVLKKIGVEIHAEPRDYVCPTSVANLEAVFVRTYDIPIYVQYGTADIGVTGRDIIRERAADVYELIDLGFGRCQLIAAVPMDSKIETVEQIPPGARIATEYPRLTTSYFEDMRKDVEIVSIRGTAELAARLGLADAIVDLTTTGETLRKNRLRVVSVILESTSRLISNKVSYKANQRYMDQLVKKLKEA